jgi:hypothetical protein
VKRVEESLVISVPATAPDPSVSVVALDIDGKPDIDDPPEITAEFPVFVNALDVTAASPRENVETRYTLDGSVPVLASPVATKPIRVTETTTVTARCFRNGKPVSGPSAMRVEKVTLLPSVNPPGLSAGLRYKYVEGEWDVLPDFTALYPLAEGIVATCDLSPRKESDRYGFEFTGYLKIPQDGVYALSTDSDDGSRLYVDGTPVVENDGIHGMKEVAGVVALAAGYHSFRLTFFDKSGGDGLEVYWRREGGERTKIPAEAFFHQ